MESQLAVFRNQEAIELFNYLVGYTRLVAKNHLQTEETSSVTLEVIPEEKEIVI